MSIIVDGVERNQVAYGLSKATVLATSVLHVGQEAASAAAQEGATGNISLANTTITAVSHNDAAHHDALRVRQPSSAVEL